MRPVVFKIASAVFVVAALFHFSHWVSPIVGDTASPMRHLVFVAIDLSVAAALYFRPWFLKYVVAVLTFQQVYSHGAQAWHAWVSQGEVDVVSIAVVLLMPILALLLFVEDR